MAVDIIVVLFAGYLCFQGYRKGFILTVFDTLGLIISFFLSKRFYYYAEDFLLNNTKLFVKLHDYFETNRIPDFRIEDIKLQIVGNYTDNRKNTRKKR